MKRTIIFLLLGAFALALISTSCADPRKNCNHPQHSQWVKEKRLKKTGF
ncbi:MAG: hypothetical protein H6581_15315 [Bacteroidia bacterium]|nr:hypothetical protein [Bacteroidia bacterium]